MRSPESATAQLEEIECVVINAAFPGDVAERAYVKPPARRSRCPYCGEWGKVDAALYGSTEDKFPTFRVLCLDCGGAGPIAPNPKLAWHLWNKRVN